MANPHRGEVEFLAGEERYSLRFSIDALCRFEAASGTPLQLLAVKLSNPALASLTLVRQLLHAGLGEAHPNLDLMQAGELIVPAGGIMAVMEKIGQALELSLPEVKASAARPRKAPRQRGTGRRS